MTDDKRHCHLNEALLAQGLDPSYARQLPSEQFPDALRVRTDNYALTGSIGGFSERKRCAVCGHVKPLLQYNSYHHPDGSTSRDPTCRSCAAAARRQRRLAESGSGT